MMVDEHDGRPIAMPGEITAEPLELRGIDDPARLSRLVRVESDEVMALVIERVVVRRIGGRGVAPQHAVEGHAMVVIALDAMQVTVLDPLHGERRVPREDF